MPICLERALFVDELLRGGRLGIVTGCGSLYEEGRAPLYLNEVRPGLCTNTVAARGGLVH